MEILNQVKQYTYQSSPEDPNGVRIYTLDNGLKVYLAQNFDEPKIQTYVAVRTGSNNDPKDNTGLAHYLEHMMFKGTTQIGTLDWDNEHKLLQEIADLYEKHKATNSQEEKRDIYKEIDRVSQEASRYALANEYDKLVAAIGASGTNAHTWFDETVYKNKIPNNALEQWLKIESNRFSELVLRLFHTELEAVYEEFNRAQDSDTRLVQQAMLNALFPTHPNGQQTTLGSAEHLKNPSMKAIHKYFDTYYVPNNMAMVLVGDLDFDETIMLVDRYFGKLKPQQLPPIEYPVEAPLTDIKKVTVKSASSPRLQMAWRSESYGTKGARLAEIVSQLLSNNGETGLLDIYINQEQKALRAAAYNLPLKQYGFLTTVIVPKEKQSLAEVEQLVLHEIEKIKQGAFPDWLIPAIVQDLRLQRLKDWERADGLATSLYESFIQEMSWEEVCREMELYAAVTKEDVVTFATEFFQDNYVAIYKENGQNEDLVRVENPEITPIQINKTEHSAFFKNLVQESIIPIRPVFVDYDKEITTLQIHDKKLRFVPNILNDLAEVRLVFDFGTDHDKELGLALSYLDYLGTEKYSPEDLKAEFYKLGVSYETKIAHNEIKINLEGPEKNLGKAVGLLHHWLGEAKANHEVYAECVNTILQGRAFSKKDKKRIIKALVNYGKYGKQSRFRDVISQERLFAINPEDLVNKAARLMTFPYEIYFYGQDLQRFTKAIEAYIYPTSQEVPLPTQFPEPVTTGKTYFANYEMVQVELLRLGRSEWVNPDWFGAIKVYNEYFGSGLSSVVFQEIREARSLGYSAYANYTYPKNLEKHDYITTYVGTQANKLLLAKDAFDELMASFPMIEDQFQNAKENVLKQMASSRVSRRKLYSQFRAIQRYHISHDIRKDIYESIQNLDLKQLKYFYEKRIQDIAFNTVVLGDKKILASSLSQLGEVEELSLEELFGY